MCHSIVIHIHQVSTKYDEMGHELYNVTQRIQFSTFCKENMDKIMKLYLAYLWIYLLYSMDRKMK